MIKQLLNITFAAIAITHIAGAAQAASPYPPKPKCPLGQIAVWKQTHWACQAPSIKAPTKPGLEASVGGSKAKVDAKTPSRAKPDLQVYSAETSNTKDNVVVVHVKNHGNSVSKGGKVQVKLADGRARSANMPNINPNQIRLIYVEFRKPIGKNRATVTADSTKVVAESNENNNVMTVAL